MGPENPEDLADLDWSVLHWFLHWPIAHVPRGGSIVYTVWDRQGSFIYVGMAGRSDTRSSASKGPFGRLDSHASGRRSGDQFCIYVCDRLILPRSHNQLAGIGAGEVSLDRLTRDFIRSELGFRYVTLGSPGAARTVEAALRKGAWASGRPVLNPLKEALRNTPQV